MKKVISCILSFVPLVGTGFMTIAMVAFGIAHQEGMLYGRTEDMVMLTLFIITLVFVLCMYGFIIYYIVKTCKNSLLSAGMKIFWCFMHYQFNALAFPVYWFMYIRHEYDSNY